MFVIGIGRQINPSLLYKLPGKQTNVQIIASGADLANAQMIGTFSQSIQKDATGTLFHQKEIHSFIYIKMESEI